MERSQPPLPQKSNSFSLSTSRGLKETDRNFSLGAIRFEDHPIRRTGGSDGGDEDDITNSVDKPETIHEGEEEEEEGEEEEEKEKVENKENDDTTTTTTTTTNGEEKEKEKEEGGSDAEETPHTDHDLNTIAEDVDQFLTSLRENGDPSPEILSSTGGVIDKFVVLLEREIIKYESGKEKLSPEHQDNEPSLLDAVDRMSKLTAALAPFSSSDPKFLDATSLTGSVLQHAMSFLEDEFFSLLEESSSAKNNLLDHGGKTKRPPPSSHDQDRCVLSPPAEPNPADSYPSPEIVARLRMIANAMITSGYETECFQVFAVARRNALSAGLSELGFEKISIDDVQRMPWDALETEIAKFCKAFRYVVTTSLPLERDLCDSVFAAHRRTAAPFSRHLAFRCVLAFLNFPEALAMIKRSTEKLFKVLDVYEALRDMIPNIDSLFSRDEAEEREDEDEPSSSPMATELKSEMSAVQSRLGEAAVAIFCDLESSIKSDVGRNVVPGGAVHPLTRYVMNYLKYACEYIGTLEQIFKEHMKSNDGSSSSYHEDDEDNNNDDDTSKAAGGGGYSSSQNSSGESNQTPFAVQLALVMDLLQANLDSKAKLYKDLALSNIFLMNNRRYILQKIKGSGEISKVLGDNWRRKQSSDLRQYHNNYKRETWSKVVACLKDEGLMVKGSVAKPMLKERFKSFNAMFEEIHKAQSMWVVSDEQLQSELRVSVSAVVVPAYRSFLGRFQQYLDPGRQTEKYIKFAAEDLEAYIDELFDGNPSSMVVKKR